jgi:2,3-bisphosphoglycerate-independent phosphoglycerate mutase
MPLPGTPLVLAILDGFGVADDSPGNAITQARTPIIDELVINFPHTTLNASGKAVGLPHDQRGNSEAGHMNLGAGRVVAQDSLYITEAIQDGSFFKNPAFLAAINYAHQHNGKVHLVGMLTGLQSPHADPDHLGALCEMLARHKFKRVFLHLFTDGRDTPRFAAIGLLKLLRERFKNGEQIATVMGRFYGMDRKKKWDRTQAAYEAMVKGAGHKVPSADEAIMQGYNRGESDEYIKPSVMVDSQGAPIATVADGDSIILFNLRSDRARQLTKAFVQTDFNALNPNSFVRTPVLKHLRFVAMTDFGPDLGDVLTAFPSRDVEGALPQTLGTSVRQLYVAEAEKFAHVTYFFNGGYANPVAGERRVLIPSPDVVSYDQTPEMGAPGVTKVVVQALTNKSADFICFNFSNPDMVGHTGNLLATIKAIQVVDECLGKIWAAVQAAGGTLVITADHGNAECKINADTGEVYTEHTAAPVPLIIASKNTGVCSTLGKLKSGGELADVAPTILQLLGLPQPAVMTGKSLATKRLIARTKC